MTAITISRPRGLWHAMASMVRPPGSHVAGRQAPARPVREPAGDRPQPAHRPVSPLPAPVPSSPFTGVSGAGLPDGTSAGFPGAEAPPPARPHPAVTASPEPAACAHCGAATGDEPGQAEVTCRAVVFESMGGMTIQPCMRCHAEYADADAYSYPRLFNRLITAARRAGWGPDWYGFWCCPSCRPSGEVAFWAGPGPHPLTEAAFDTAGALNAQMVRVYEDREEKIRSIADRQRDEQDAAALASSASRLAA